MDAAGPGKRANQIHSKAPPRRIFRARHRSIGNGDIVRQLLVAPHQCARLHRARIQDRRCLLREMRRPGGPSTATATSSRPRTAVTAGSRRHISTTSICAPWALPTRTPGGSERSPPPLGCSTPRTADKAGSRSTYRPVRRPLSAASASWTPTRCTRPAPISPISRPPSSRPRMAARPGPRSTCRHTRRSWSTSFSRTQNEGWVVGGRDDVGRPTPQRKRDDVKPVVLHTTDGGATWTDRLVAIRRFFPRGEWGWKIQMLDAQTLFVSLENMLDGAILRSDDGGLTWRRIPINDRQRNANLEGIGFVDRDRGWVGGWGDIDFVGRFHQRLYRWRQELGQRQSRSASASIAFASSAIRSPSRMRVATPCTNSPTSHPSPPCRMAAAARRRDGGAPAIGDRRAVSTSRFPAGAHRLKINIWDRFGRHVNVLAEEISPAAGPENLVMGLPRHERRSPAARRLHHSHQH